MNLVSLTKDITGSAHWKQPLTGSRVLPRTIFGEIKGWFLLSVYCFLSLHKWDGTIMRFSFAWQAAVVYWSCRLDLCVLRIVHKIALPILINDLISFLATRRHIWCSWTVILSKWRIKYSWGVVSKKSEWSKTGLFCSGRLILQ